MPNFYLGISATVHDPSIAIINEHGELLFAESLERVMQHKIGWDISPVGMFVYFSDLISRFHTPDSVWNVGLSWKFDAKPVEDKSAKTAIDLSEAPNPYAIPDKLWGQWLMQLQKQYLERLEALLPFTLSAVTGQKNIILHKFDHHLTHAANAAYFYNSVQPALVIVADGEGEVGSLSCYKLVNRQLTRIGKSWGPGSLGGFYGTVTNLIGFDLRRGEEWKLMGLAAYGEFDEDIYQELRPLVTFYRGNLVAPADEYRNKIIAKYSLGTADYKKAPIKAANIAFVAQFIFEEVMLEIVEHYTNKSGLRNVVLAGGCALNSRFNGLLSERGLCESVFVPPAPGDDGNSVGVAAMLYQQVTGNSCLAAREFMSPYLGHKMNEVILGRAVAEYPSSRTFETYNELNCYIAQQLAEGKLVAWVQGGSEFGPRALGNRSILASPAVPDIKNIINNKVKFREEYRPFAPAILHEHGSDWFESYSYWPYMSAAISWKSDKCHVVPGVVHSDNTGRVQSVTQQSNPVFYALIKEFYELTGIPILLNTSLNVMGKPIVHSVEDALGVFMTSGLDILVIDKHIFTK